MNVVERIWGRLSANLKPSPKEYDMASVSRIAPSRQAETATINWLFSHIEEGKTEPHYAQAIIVPGVASALLDRNPNNRNLSDRKCQQYASDMINGRWAVNGEPIIVSDTGELNDGQHRLQAVILSNRPQLFWIGFGFQRETRTTLDQGMARTSAHYLAMDGVKYAALSAGVARFVMSYEQSNGQTIKINLTHGEVVARVKADDDILAAVEFAEHNRKFCKGLLTPTQIGGCFYLFCEINEVEATEYLERVCVGENIKRGDPAFAVRQALSGLDGEQRSDRVEIVFRGWNAHRQSRKLQLAKTLHVLPALV